jgi:hypothetical protein
VKAKIDRLLGSKEAKAQKKVDGKKVNGREEKNFRRTSMHCFPMHPERRFILYQ